MDNRIINVLDHIEDHLGQEVRLKDLADIACMSTSQFHRLFKREVGTTPFKFIEELKINKAYQLILHEGATVQDLALKLGYNDYETFSRAFKKYFYLAPDDLKSVAQEVRSQFKSGEKLEIMFMTAEEDSTEEEIKEKFVNMVQEKGLSMDQVPQSIAFRVQRIEDQPGKAVSVKKKLEIVPDKKLWNKLVKQNN